MELLSRVQLFATPWTIAHQAPASMGFPRPEYWSGLPFLSPGDLPNPGLPQCRPILYQLSHQGSLTNYEAGYICLPPTSEWSSIITETMTNSFIFSANTQKEVKHFSNNCAHEQLKLNKKFIKGYFTDS